MARIVEGQLPYSGGTGIDIDANKVIKILLRDENNLIQVNNDNELYTDLQLADGIKPTDEFPVGVTVGKVLASDGWWESGMLLNMKTTSGDYSRWIYGQNGKLYFDNGSGTFTQIYSSTEVDTLLTQLRNSLATVAFSGDYNDLINRPSTVQLQADRDQTDTTSPDYIKNKPTIPTKTSELTNDSGFIDSNVNNLANYTLSYLLSAVALSNDYDDLDNKPTIPTVIDNLTSTDANNALSANQGKVLNDKINDLFGQGKFLSLWNASTGMPMSFPYSTPYTYSTGDYYLVEVTGTSNKRPDGASYTGVASTTSETDELEVGDVYIYDGATWLLQTNHGKTVSFANLAGQPSDNTALSNALALKANDADVVHITGTETITGQKTFDATNTYISNVGLSKTTNLLSTTVPFAIRASNSNPFIGLQDSSGTKYYLQSQGGVLYLGPTSASAMKFTAGGNATFQGGSVEAKDGFIKTGGTSSQFLKADGSVDSNAYITSAAISDATVNFKQNSVTKGSITMNQSTGSDVNLETTIPVTQTQYDALPSSKTSDGNLYLIYG